MFIISSCNYFLYQRGIFERNYIYKILLNCKFQIKEKKIMCLERIDFGKMKF